MFDSNERVIQKFSPVVDIVNSFDEEVKKLDISELRKEVDQMRSEVREFVQKVPQESYLSLKAVDRKNVITKEEKDIQNKLLEIMPRYYAILREVAGRYFGRRHFDVQILAGVILAQGQKLAELRTGEGKTQVFHLPLSLYGLTGRGVHAVTVNDYLAKRDGEYAGFVLSKLGFTVGVITPEHSYKYVDIEELSKFKSEDEVEEARKLKVINPGDTRGYNLVEVSKKEAYACDIVYGTNNEFGFDYLRDNMANSLERISQGELYFCIVDEADSILIDEARTPLIISTQAEQSNKMYEQFASLVKNLKIDDDYTVDEKAHSVVLTESGIEKMESMLGTNNIWQDYKLAHHLDNALKAEALYKIDKEYIVQNGEVLIVDQFTGRVLAGRRYSEGLHQAIEAKEKVDIKRESKTLATITFQNFFRLYKILNGASGTIMTEAEEFYKIYNLDSVSIPTNRPVTRIDHIDRVFKNRVSKFNAVAEEIEVEHAKGRPILVGTTSIEDSEYLSRLLDKKGIKHEVLNAKYHEREARIVAEAGAKGAVTVATNMAGRGTDIKLGGQNATDTQYKEVLELGGLYVIGTERHEARRIDNQLRGRSGRQGEAGESRFFIGLDDQIMRIQGGNIVQKLMEITNIPDDMPLESRMVGGAIENAQKRMEGMNFDVRKRLVEYDDVMNQQREIFYVRRRSILELSENAKGKFFRGKEVILKEDINLDEYIKKLQEKIKEYLDTQLDNIIQEHFFEDRKDEEDVKKTVDTFLDLINDSDLRSFIKNDNESDIRKILLSNLKDKRQEDLQVYLSDLLDKVAKKKFTDYGKDLAEVARQVFLETFDQMWSEHIETMQDLREGINLRGYAQRDPLVEYKNESFDVFERFISKLNSEISRRILKMVRVEKYMDEPVQLITNDAEIENINTGSREILPTQIQSNKSEKIIQPLDNKFKNVGRNDLCPCGSGKKFKKCHGKGL